MSSEEYEEYEEYEEIEKDDDELIVEQAEFLPERNVFERAGLSRVMSVFQIVITGKGDYSKSISELSKKLFRHNMSPDELFKTFVIIAWKRFEDDLGMTPETVDELLIKADYLDDIKYKNPIAYVLAYNTLSKGSINQEKFNRVVEYAKKINEVKTPDILRYARLWETLLKR